MTFFIHLRSDISHGAPQEPPVVAKDGHELDTDDKIKMHLVVCPRPCVPSLNGGRKEPVGGMIVASGIIVARASGQIFA